jgi:hypothetical protein
LPGCCGKVLELGVVLMESRKSAFGWVKGKIKIKILIDQLVEIIYGGGVGTKCAGCTYEKQQRQK